MIKFLSIFLLLVCSGTLLAQEPELNVKSFRKLESDLDARINEPEKDQNGDLCAILKIVTTQKGFIFDCGQVGIVKSVQKPSEIWVYVPYGVKHITISHPHLGILRDYMIPQNIEKACVYELVLISGSVVTTVHETIVTQWLVLTPEPEDAMIYIDDKFVKSGTFQGKLKPGKYSYRVEAPLYHSEAGKLEISNTRKELNIHLKPAFGLITVASDPELDAKVFVDGKTLPKTTPCHSDPLTGGEHTVQVVKDLFQPASQKVMVEEGKTTSVKLLMAPNFAAVSLTAPPEADLFVENRFKGKGNWQGRLNAGVYTMEARLKNHRAAKKEVEVVTGDKLLFELKPEPICGSLDIITNPVGASIRLEGKSFGTAPNTLTNLLIGEYHLQLTLPGYQLLNKTITVSEGKLTEINESLSKEVALSGQTSQANGNGFQKPEEPNKSYYKYKKAKNFWLGSAVLTGLAGTIGYLQAGKYYDQYKSATTDAASIHNKVQTFDTIYPVCFALSGISILEFIVKSGKQGKERKQSIGLNPYPVRGGAALNLSCNF